MKRVIVLIVAALLPFVAVPASAAQLRVFVAEMNAIGAPNRDEMRLSLQTLLASRLTGDKIIAVSSANEADVLVNGTYIVIGKVFSMDAVAKSSSGRTLARTFIQGPSSEELILSIGNLAEKLSAELNKLVAGGELTATAYVPAPALPTPPPSQQPLSAADLSRADQAQRAPNPDIIRAEPPQRPKNTDIIRADQVQRAQAGDIIRKPEFVKGSTGGWISKRLPGAANLMTVGAVMPDGTREIFLAQDNRIQYFRQGDDMKLVAAVEFKANEKVISIDAADADGDGAQEVYVTIVREDELASQIWEVQGTRLVRVAADVPYYFRAIALAGGPKKLYAQEMGRDEDYYGPVREVHRTGAKITLTNPMLLPRFGNIYNFNQFHDQSGNLMTVLYSPDDYLVVYDQNQKEIWRSTDSFGGTALYFQRDDINNARVTGQRYRWVFMTQRIQVTAKNEILVGKNEGFFVIGNNRSYKRGAVYNMVWDGSSLEERWRTKETQSYLPDYWFDEARNELLMLQMPQKPGIGTEGAASLAIKKVD